MFKPASSEEKQAWKEKIEQQRRSGLPITHWCKENRVTIGQFYYWKEKFFPCSIHRSEFLELKRPENVEIKVECNGVFIHLGSHFDALTFKRCLTIVKESSHVDNTK